MFTQFSNGGANARQKISTNVYHIRYVKILYKRHPKC
jgi:hypothetical protein